MPAVPILQAAPELIAPYRNLKDCQVKARAGLFIAEGLEVVRRLLQSRHQVLSLLVTADRLARLTDDLRPDVPVIVAEYGQIEALAGFNVHRGALACGRRPANVELAEVPAARDRTRASLVVALENVTDAINIGVIIRSAAVFGADLVILHRCCDAYYRRAVRVSMGNVFRVPLRVCPELATDLAELHDRYGYERCAAVTDPGALPLGQAPVPRRRVVVFGAEGDGLSPAATSACDQHVTIPMSPGSDSLNVGVATGILLHHYALRRA